MLESAERGWRRCVSFLFAAAAVVVITLGGRGKFEMKVLIMGRVLRCPAEKGVRI